MLKTRTLSLVLLLVMACVGRVQADQVLVYPAADNTLYQSFNRGLSNGEGSYVFAGKTASGQIRRALVRFDLTGIPAGSTITGVSLHMRLSRTISGNQPVSLHRVHQAWGEGASNASGQEGMGAPSEPGDATWLHTFYPDSQWLTAGGDFDPTPSATTTVSNQTGSFFSWTSPDMIVDVQVWVDDLFSNHGWLLMGNEANNTTAKRFDSKDNFNQNYRPYLVVDFIPAVGTGACCYGDGTCMITTEADCFASGGQYQGDNTDCIDAPCPLTPFVDPLPRLAVAQPVIGEPGGEATYDISIQQTTQQLHRDLPPTTIWGYGGSFPGPTIEATTGLPVTVRWINDLRDENGQLRTDHYLSVDLCPNGATDEPRTVTHLQGGHVPAEVDGYPEDTYLPGEFVEYVYPNNQQAATLWYHDHAMGITRLNVSMGLAGFYLVRDDIENALDLPKDTYEIPLAIQDRILDRATGQFVYPDLWQDAYYGDTILVNGKVWPSLEVDQGKYRFRVLNGSTSRTYTLSLSNSDPITIIGTEGGLLTAPVVVSEVTITPGERMDVVIDFASYAPGTEIILTNSAPAPFPGDPGVGVVPDVMQFIVTANPGHTNPLPTTLREVPPLDPADAVVVRPFELQQFTDPCAGSIWLINGLGWETITESPDLGTIEVWEFINRSAISHPMHIHMVMSQVVNRQAYEVIDGEIVPIGDPILPLPEEQGWQDTIQCPPGQITRVIQKFENYTGKFPYHSNTLELEDHEMMRQFKIYCPADFNKDDTINTIDVLTFLNAWATGDPQGDFNHDGEINTLDVLAFLNAWATGC